MEFLSAIFYPQKKDFLVTIQKYIDFSQNKELYHMDGLGMSILEEGIEQGIERGMKQGIERGKAKQTVK